MVDTLVRVKDLLVIVIWMLGIFLILTQNIELAIMCWAVPAGVSAGLSISNLIINRRR